ncbi:hypothetical protein ACQCX2_14055 [Propionibacteriaceae bacterium Y1700]|uniref:hypothetical protein n=1 Tax=Microlunatus sp. Y1700 TaxID=3418487 RepID=UPI003DA72575
MLALLAARHAEQTLHQGRTEGDRLAGAGLAAAQHVTALQHLGDGRGLDRERLLSPHLTQHADDATPETQVGERHLRDILGLDRAGLKPVEHDVLGRDELRRIGTLDVTASRAIVAVEVTTGRTVITIEVTTRTIITLEAAALVPVELTTSRTVITIEVTTRTIITLEAAALAPVELTTSRTVITIEVTTRTIITLETAALIPVELTTSRTLVTLETVAVIPLGTAVIPLEVTARAVVAAEAAALIAVELAARWTLVTAEAAAVIATLAAARGTTIGSLLVAELLASSPFAALTILGALLAGIASGLLLGSPALLGLGRLRLVGVLGRAL